MNTDTLSDLRQLWQAAFGDSDAQLDCFFGTAFHPERCHYIEKNGKPVSALHWFPCSLDGRPVAYLYAIATDAAYRGQGLCRQLLIQTHQILNGQGYVGAILVPAEPGLFDLYRKFGYRVCCTCREFSRDAGDQPTQLKRLNAAEYATLRAKYLPQGGVLQEGVTLHYLEQQASFYEGEGFVFAATVQDNILTCHELLGDPSAAEGIVRALRCNQGHFRAPGTGRDFAMFLPLVEDCPTPRWFGLALD